MARSLKGAPRPSLSSLLPLPPPTTPPCEGHSGRHPLRHWGSCELEVRFGGVDPPSQAAPVTASPIRAYFHRPVATIQGAASPPGDRDTEIQWCENPQAPLGLLCGWPKRGAAVTVQQRSGGPAQGREGSGLSREREDIPPPGIRAPAERAL